VRCVIIDANGHVVDVVPQPVTFEACAFVLSSGAEVVASPFALDSAAAVSLGGAFAALWSVAYCLKLLRRQLWES